MRRDAELVEAFRAGDELAGEALVDKYYGRILGFFRNKVPSRCNDLAQRTFLGCFEGLDRLREPSRFRSFLFGVASNQLRKHYERDRRDDQMLDSGSVSSADLDASPSQIVADREQERLLLEGLRNIPLQHQIVLELSYWEGMTAAEIAQALEIPLGTAKTRLRAGRQQLAAAIAQFDDDAAVLESTVTRLDDWADGLRARVISGRAGA